MTSEEYAEFTGSLNEALAGDGIDPSQVDVRLQGSSAHFFSGAHKDFPTTENLAGQPEAQAKLEAWTGDRPESERPVRVPFDAKHRLGMIDKNGSLEEPSNYDVQISSTDMVNAARDAWNLSEHAEGNSFIHSKYDFIDKGTVRKAFPSMTAWTERWEAELGREVAPALFDSNGPPDMRGTGKGVSAHFRSSDWIINQPESSR